MIGLLPHYIHTINPSLKHTYLTFNEQGELLIKSPGLSPAEIEKLILQKSGWIRKSQNRLLAKKGQKVDFNNKTTLYYLGKGYPLKMQKSEQKRAALHFDGQAFILHYHHFDPELFHRKINHFYKTAAQHYIPPLVYKWAEQMTLFPKEIRFRKTKRQWGSCSSANILSFNTMLMKLPKEAVEYVIIHELAHIRHKHHQKAFWKLVEDTMPSYKEQVAVLKTYTPT